MRDLAMVHVSLQGGYMHSLQGHHVAKALLINLIHCQFNLSKLLFLTHLNMSDEKMCMNLRAQGLQLFKVIQLQHVHTFTC